MSYSETLQGETADKSLERASDRGDISLVEAVAERSSFQDQLYVRYRRPLLQVFLHRRIDRDAAEDLLQRTFLQVIKKIRAEGLEDPSNLGLPLSHGMQARDGVLAWRALPQARQRS